MSQAVATANPAESDEVAHDPYRVIISSVGTATPQSAASIAIGLGVPVQRVLEAFYRAPTVLVDGLSSEMADHMVSLLNGIGCSVSAESEAEAIPAQSKLFDVALYISDTARFAEITSALATFLGASDEQAAKLISTPPGIVLGSVSAATVDALAGRLGDGAELTRADPDAAVYDVFLGQCDYHIRRRLFSDLKTRGFSPVAEAGCILGGLNKLDADRLWAAHKAGGQLAVVNREFLRFDIVLTGGALDEKSHMALTEIAGIPDRFVAQVFDALPITIVEAVRQCELEEMMTALTAAGLDVRADLVTFLHLGLEITDAPGAVSVGKLLTSLGLKQPATGRLNLPLRLPFHFPEVQARVLRDTLIAQGLEVDLIDETGGAQ